MRGTKYNYHYYMSNNTIIIHVVFEIRVIISIQKAPDTLTLFGWQIVILYCQVNHYTRGVRVYVPDHFSLIPIPPIINTHIHNYTCTCTHTICIVAS